MSSKLFIKYFCYRFHDFNLKKKHARHINCKLINNRSSSQNSAEISSLNTPLTNHPLQQKLKFPDNTVNIFEEINAL
jgi:hypothetical protein